MRRCLHEHRECLSVIFITLLLSVANGAASALTVDRVLATVNNEVVTLSDYRRYLLRTDPAVDRETVSEQHLKRLIEDRLVLQEGKKAGIDVTEEELRQSVEDFRTHSGLSQAELEKQLADEGLTMHEYRSQIKDSLISLKIIDKEVNARVIVNADDAVRFYEQSQGLFLESPEKVLVKAIFVKLGDNATLTEITDLKRKSLRIITDIRNGEPFEKLAMQHTDESIRRRDAVLGEFVRGTLIPSLDEKIFTLKDGEVSDPVWTKDGVYILKVIQRNRPVYTSFDKVRDQISAKVYEQKREEKFNEWMKRLWEKSSVTIRQQ